MAEDLLSTTIFEVMTEEVQNYSNQLGKTKALVVYKITKDGKKAATWTMDFRSVPGQIYLGEPKDRGKPKVTVTVADEIFTAMAMGEIDGIQAFMSGKVKAKGDVLLLQKLNTILKGARKSLL